MTNEIANQMNQSIEKLRATQKQLAIHLAEQERHITKVQADLAALKKDLLEVARRAKR